MFSTVIEVLFAAKKYQVAKLIRKCTKVCARAAVLAQRSMNSIGLKLPSRAVLFRFQYMKKGVGVDNACILFETTPQLMEEEQVVLKFIGTPVLLGVCFWSCGAFDRSFVVPAVVRCDADALCVVSVVSCRGQRRGVPSGALQLP